MNRVRSTARSTRLSFSAQELGTNNMEHAGVKWPWKSDGSLISSASFLGLTLPGAVAAGLKEKLRPVGGLELIEPHGCAFAIGQRAGR